MKPELEKISSVLRQTGGIKPVTTGTPIQIKYLMKNKEGKRYLFR